MAVRAYVATRFVGIVVGTLSGYQCEYSSLLGQGAV